ncbi:MAG TPA: acetoacetate--CoA ligase [Gammaproteobacteria bacterium]|jgi:acetoacetyl-CoA synthetase|nr:acetoacetate--CoA ligase [Gammaproteobacteria bacterium]HBP83935.1 acetoacetate--CoA ligase [Gammaproteobacteria bacterium]|tara:strand:- start:175 stop:2127 length:1953 start_codon:yes stop_codon:yes gene_type:complete
MTEQPLWQPAPEQIASTNVTRFAREASLRWGRNFEEYVDLHRWSVEAPEEFWLNIWDWTGVIGTGDTEPVVVDREQMPGARWFPNIRLNFAQNLLRRQDAALALIFQAEDRVTRSLSFAELYAQVARLADGLKQAGVVPGDRVCGFMPNMPETVAAMLASASVGAVWSSCSPDFGVQGVLDRFGQISPKVLFSADGYWYNGKTHDSLEKLREITDGLPSLEHTVVVPLISDKPELSSNPGARLITDFETDAMQIDFEILPFDHPLYIMYSSGTTGVPKCIVHGAGGSLLKHLVEQQLHVDLRPNDRLFYFTTCGWMMWNWLVSGLASGATVVLYDGSPFFPDGNVVFDLVMREQVGVLGTSAKYIDAIAKAGLRPRETHDLSHVRTILSTGSPLIPESFDYIYDAVSDTACLSSISGGTDIMGCFIGGNPNLPVWRGEIQCPILGMQIEVWNDGGAKVPDGEKGELVCVNAFPSMPIGFWDDPEDSKFKAAYFEKFPGVWCHGDYISVTEHGGIVVFGRSDAVLNPGGVRIGTAEIYRQAERIEQVLESLVIGQQWKGDVRVVLFVRLREGEELDDALRARICSEIRQNTTPRHVPAKVIQVEDIPRTKSGKIVELAVRKIVHGEPVLNREALANPEALDLFANLPELDV